MTGKNRRTIFDIPQYSKQLMVGYLEACEKTRYPEESRACLLVVFEGGFRASEALMITPDQCSWNDEAIVIYNAIVLKKQRTRRGVSQRDIYIKVDEKNPLGYAFRDLLESCTTKYLIPKRKRFSRELVRDLPMSYRTLKDRISAISPDIFPHALRGLRATMLTLERDFSIQDLLNWFQWSRADIALHYSRTRDVSKKMGISNVPLKRTSS